MAPLILKLGTRCCEWLASCPAALSMDKDPFGFRLTGMGPRVSLNTSKERQILYLCQESSHNFLYIHLHSLVIIPTTLSQLLTRGLGQDNVVSIVPR